MLPLTFMCCGLALGLARSTKVTRERFAFRGWMWLGLAGALLLARSLVHLNWLTSWLWIATQAALITFLLANRANRGSLLVAGGITLNTVVMALNGGMPVSASAARIAGVPPPTTGSSGHLLLGPDSLFGFLGDILPFAPAGKVLSIGDLLLLAGLAVLSYTVGSALELERKASKPSDQTRTPKPKRRFLNLCLNTT